jgi:hypothetical protein
MTIKELIFSNERNMRLSRHLIFWLCWFLYMALTTVRLRSPEEIGVKGFILYQLSVSTSRIILQIFFCYTIVYFFLPKYLKKDNYRRFSFACILLLFCCYGISYLYYWVAWINPVTKEYGTREFYNWLFNGHVESQNFSPFRFQYFIFYSHFNFSGTIVSCGIIVLIKYYKNWNKKQRENELLINKNTQAELQLLKAQVHPHFLFNTFNNIYALTLDDSPKAAITIKKLSGMVHYMINEGAESLVPVNKEVKMLLDYIGLEKIRYGERLDMTTEIKQAHDGNRLIAPLLMLPFVENCFKHGASKTMNNASIQLFIETTNDWLELKLTNTRPTLPEIPDDRKKIGLQNVQKRLALLYPGQHQLNIQSDEVSFSVHMKVKLEKRNKIIEYPEQKSTRPEKISYAY